MTFYRLPKDKNYTCVSNYFLEDPSLSAAAKGVMTYILSCDRKKFQDWILYKSKLLKHFLDGKDAITTALKNLEEQGYLEIRKEQNGRRTKLFFTVWEIPKNNFERNSGSENQNTKILSSEACADFQNTVSGNPVMKPYLCAENSQVLNTNLNTTTTKDSDESSSSNLKKLMKEMSLSVSDDFFSSFKSFAESKNLTEEQSESYIRWIYETRKKSAHNINSFIYTTACKENLLNEYMNSLQKKEITERKIFCKACGKEQTFQEQREACCHGCGKDYLDFSQYSNIKDEHQEEYADGSTDISTE